MMKRLLVLIAFCGMSLHLTGCTSTDSKSDSEPVSEYDSSELEKLDGQGSADTTATAAPAVDSALTSDKLPEDALGESVAASPNEATKPDLATKSDLSLDNNAPPAEAPAATETAAAATATDIMPPAPDASSAPSAVAETTPTPLLEPTSSDVTNVTPTEPAAKSASSPLQKIAAAPWTVGKTMANTVYFARPGDTLSNVSQMIYGADKTKELKKINPTYKNRSLKAGDKVYYNSPHRPDDSAKIITFYEDNGIAPEVYTAKAGDNIRKVSKGLLGYDGAWKEVWASNSVDSKSSLDAGTELKFWKGGGVAAAPVAPHGELATNETTAALPTEQHAAAPEQAQIDLPPPPPMPQEQAAQTPPPPQPEMAQNAAPPPPPAQMELPPPPPPPMAMEKKADRIAGETPASGMDNDTTLALAVVGLAAAGLAVLIVMRKKRKQKEIDHGINNDTQVGS